MMADTEVWQNTVEMFFAQAERLGVKPFLWVKSGQVYTPLSWSDTANQVLKLAAGFKALGIKTGDRIIILSENRPEWCIADLAIMTVGAITVPVYTTNTAEDHRHVVENSGAKGVIISKRKLAERFFPAAHESDLLGFAIIIEPPELAQNLNVTIHTWHDMLAREVDVSEVREQLSAIKPDDTACIIYTSGTGGAPKGVMIHHGALLHNCRGAKDVVAELGLGNDRFLSFLPLSHAYEHTGGQFLPIYLGAEIFYGESLDRLATNMQECHPTIMTVVPRLFELLRLRITRAIKDKGGLAAKMFDRALSLGSKAVENPNSMSLIEKTENAMLTLLVRSQVRKRFGSKIKALVSGGAPLNYEVGLFFAALGVPLLQGYGQTESGPVICVNRPSSMKLGTVGPPLKDTDVMIAEDGEILVRGALVMKGYWRDEEATALALRDGWLHTGDIGIFDEDGHLVITDRKKDIIVNDKGENVSPQRIEGMLTLEPEISQAMIYGDRKTHLVALLVPDAEFLKSSSKNSKTDILKAVDVAVSRVNKRVSNIEKIRRFALADEPFSIENAQMTPTLKIRRHIISSSYREILEGLY